MLGGLREFERGAHPFSRPCAVAVSDQASASHLNVAPALRDLVVIASFVALNQSRRRHRSLPRHAQLVGEAADSLIVEYREPGVEFDASLIELGAAIHDAGKIVHPEELSGPGSRHERRERR